MSNELHMTNKLLFLFAFAFVWTISFHNWLVYVELHYLQHFLQSLLTIWMHISCSYDMSYVLHFTYKKSELWAYMSQNLSKLSKLSIPRSAFNDRLEQKPDSWKYTSDVCNLITIWRKWAWVICKLNTIGILEHLGLTLTSFLRSKTFFFLLK